MSWLLSRIYDGFMRETERACLAEWRRELLAPLAGQVLEIGAGTGANLPHYGGDVSRLVLAEPDPHMRRKLAARVAEREVPAEVLASGVEALPDGFDAVVCTLVLCSVPDLDQALREIHRALRPGGRLIFIEHVAAAAGSERLLWQRRLEPVWVRIAAGCHLTRRTDEAILRAGFALDSVRHESVRKALPWVRPSIRGVAIRT